MSEETRRKNYPPMPDKPINVGAVILHVMTESENYAALRNAFRPRLQKLVAGSGNWKAAQRMAWELINDFEDALAGIAAPVAPKEAN